MRIPFCFYVFGILELSFFWRGSFDTCRTFGYWNHGCMERGSVPLACATGSPPGAGCQSAHLALWHCKMRIYDMYLTIYIYDYVYEIIWVYIYRYTYIFWFLHNKIGIPKCQNTCLETLEALNHAKLEPSLPCVSCKLLEPSKIGCRCHKEQKQKIGLW